MTPQILVQLIVTLGPLALELIPKLAAVWHKETLTTEEVLKICSVSEKSYDDYVKNPSK